MRNMQSSSENDMSYQESRQEFEDAAIFKFLLTGDKMDEDLEGILKVCSDQEIISLYCSVEDATNLRANRLMALIAKYRGCFQARLSSLRYMWNEELDLPYELIKYKPRLEKLVHLRSALRPHMMRILAKKNGISFSPPRKLF
jgi:hypothetical protein